MQKKDQNGLIKCNDNNEVVVVDLGDFEIVELDDATLGEVVGGVDVNNNCTTGCTTNILFCGRKKKEDEISE